MWLFTKYGFFSVVAAKQMKGQTVTRNIDKSRLMVRARVRKHLVNLQKRFPVIRELPIKEDESADYRFRLIVPKEAWKQINQDLAEEIDYGNFKGLCEKSSEVDDQYTKALHEIWHIHHRLQESSQSQTEG
jgi:hypothetical protein